jgi:glutamyl-tRNA synthetase
LGSFVELEGFLFGNRKEKMIKVRFAPSPTGFLHIGGARTALFNWMYARSQNGIFVLRIEDTDRERSKEEYLQEILKSMEWLGLNWDEFCRQKDRFPIYLEHAKKLLVEGKAYQEGEAIILKMSAHPPKADGEAQKVVKFFDLIRGEIEFDTKFLKDEVLMKSDGSPTYSFACVVDDALMGISHVIRGEDHISNTPKQLMIYQALGFKPPKFAHLPLIMDAQGGRMSKRTGAVAVSEYKAMGFLPEAVVNYLMLLGWSPGQNQEKIRLDAAVKKFSIKKVNKAAAAFSIDKLKWLNAQYIKEMPTESLADVLVPFLKEKGWIADNFDRKKLEEIVKLYKNRMATLTEFLERTEYLFTEEAPADPQAKDQRISPQQQKNFELLSERLSQVKEFDVKATEEAFRRLVAEKGIASEELVHPVRVILTGTDVGPGLFETMAVLGKEKTVRRLREAANKS